MRQSTRLMLNASTTLARMGLTVVLGLVATRVAIGRLGQVDFGILTVLGAAGGLLNVVTEGLTGSLQRHLSVMIGRGDENRLREIFNTGFFTFLGLASLVAVVGLIVPWVVVPLLDIPPERETAAMWVCLSTALRIVALICGTPFRAMATSRQRMVLLAIADALSGVLTLAAALLIVLSPIDKLVFYSAMLTVAGAMVECTLAIIVMRQYPEARPHRGWFRRSEMLELMAFAAWAITANVAWQIRNQGCQFIINKFFGVKANTAYGVSQQAASYQSTLGSAVQSASSPVLMASEGRGDRSGMHRLTLLQAKYAAMASLVYVVPVILEADILLRLWLGADHVPEGAVQLLPLVVGFMWVQGFSNGLNAPIWASGKMGPYVLANLGAEVVALAGVVAVLLALSPPVWAVPLTVLGFVCVQMLMRSWIVSRAVDLTVSRWMLEVVWPALAVAVAGFGAGLVPRMMMDEGPTRLTATVVAAWVGIAPAAWFIAMSAWERGHFSRVFGALVSRATALTGLVSPDANGRAGP